MRVSTGTAFLVAIAANGACGYPEFGFVPEDDTGAIDGRVIETSGSDATLDAVDTAYDSLASDSTAGDTRDAAIDSGLDAPRDTFVAPPDTLGDVYDTSPTCALIDDLEDGNGAIISKCGRSGYWFTFNDGTVTGTQTPPLAGPFTPSAIPGGRAGSLYAARTYGSGFTDYGAGIGMQFAGGTTPYDAHGWSGIAFWARIGSGTVATMRMDFPDTTTDPHGGKCGTDCYDHFGLSLTFDTTWKYYVVKWSDLAQEGWGFASPTGKIDAYHLYDMQIQTGSSSVFDVWLDDVTFVP